MPKKRLLKLFEVRIHARRRSGKPLAGYALLAVEAMSKEDALMIGCALYPHVEPERFEALPLPLSLATDPKT